MPATTAPPSLRVASAGTYANATSPFRRTGLLVDQLEGFANFATSVAWVSNGLAVVGKALPAVGFALLLSYMDIKKYWPFMIVGYVLFAYMGVGTIGLALVGAAAGALYIKGGAQ